MELKLPSVHLQPLRYAGSNRTFMELKFVFRCLLRLFRNVLIVPLWN